MAGMRPATLTDSATIPLPRRPLDPSDQVRRWYENELGWPLVPGAPGSPPLLRMGPRFDVLDVPAEAGRAALRHLTPESPVAVQGDRMRLLLAAGSAQEVPGVLDWLEWGALPLDLTALGEGGLMEAPRPPGQRPSTAVRRPVDPVPGEAVRQWRAGLPGPRGVRPLPPDRSASVQGAAVWLRPPEPGGEVEASLPTLSALGGGGGAPDLVRVLDTVATRCHRLWLRRTCAQSSACP
ncbi:SCO3374 family protein [Streptomyces muensis]|uniref:SCO3374 family protein n=1 Tax=Streptomyces muensis TaxID=1077944 RepID=A0A9X1TQ31_STRM4|nr:SCO3374 family protein [Streptomyces muensis]MCF1599397.1 SCO3374 family protein [Streptomyces muensis]